MSKKAKTTKTVMFSTIIPRQLRAKLKALAKKKKITLGSLVVSALNKVR